MSHTPGPWKVHDWERIIDNRGITITNLHCYGISSFDEMLANAKIMAAAPELLEACKEMVKHLVETDFDVCGTSDEKLNRWKAAINKATNNV